MSRTTLTMLKGPASTGNAISLASGNSFYSFGYVTQTLQVRTDARNAYASAVSGDGTTITDLNITITPKFANSLLLITWMINAEIQWDNVFLVHQNGALITTVGYQGYNNDVGNVRYSGIVAGAYDGNTDSTMSNWCIQYAVPALSTATRTYAPAVRSSGATAYTLFLNRPAGAVGQDNYENTISTGVIMEICQ